MNLSKIRIFTLLLVLIFWSFSGFTQSGEPQEKPKAPKAKESVKEAKNMQDKKTDKKVSESKNKSKADESQTVDTKNTDTKETKTVENKTDDKKQTPSKTNHSTPSPSDNSASSPPKSKDNKVETLEVTGSYIRRSDIEGPSPILIFEREEIERSGFDSVGGFLSRHTTVFPFGGGGIRGLGPGYALVLVNGQRLPKSGSSYSTSGGTSTSLIPLAAVERIEILKDGASATYGSHALGGVINIITRKDMDGMAVVAKYNMTDYRGGDSLRTSLAYGDNFSKGNFLTSLQYTHSTKLRSSDIERVKYAGDLYNQSTNYVVPRVGIKPGPDCKRYDKQGRCEDHVTPEIVSLPSHSLDWVNEVTYKIFDDMELYSTFYLGYAESSNRSFSPTLGPAGLEFSAREIPQAWKNHPGINGPTRVWHRITELPGTEQGSQSLLGGLIVGLKGYWGSSDWVWDVTLNNQMNRSIGEYRGRVLEEPIRQALTGGTYNPFGSPRNTNGFSYDVKGWDGYQVHWLDMKTNGDLGHFFGFDWASAFGFSVAHFGYKDESDDVAAANKVIGLKGADSSGQRQLYAAFTEFSGLYDNFEVQLAFRGDFFSDFGSTLNPKLAFRYAPLNWLMLRTSWGTGFKAPSLQQAYGPQLQGFLPAVDWVRCTNTNKDGCRYRDYQATQGANPDIGPETFQNFNFGVVLEPLKNLNFSVDYWSLTLEDTIGYSVDGLLRVAAIDPTAPDRYNMTITRDPENKNEITHIKALISNIGKKTIQGLDFGGSYKIPEPFFNGTFTLSTDFTYQFHYYSEFYKELGRDQLLGRSGIPRWRNVAGLTYKLGAWRGQLTGRSFAKYEKSARVGFIPSHTQYDLSIMWDSPWGQFQLGSLNAFDSPPEYDNFEDNRARVDTSIYMGERTFFLGYRQDF